MGEYYVFDWLINQKKDKNNEFFNAVCKINLSTTIIFFLRMLNDYEQLINDKPENWDIFIPDNIELPEIDAFFIQCC